MVFNYYIFKLISLFWIYDIFTITERVKKIYYIRIYIKYILYKQINYIFIH